MYQTAMNEAETSKKSGTTLNDEPLIRVFEQFLTKAERSALLDAAQARLKPARVSAARTGVSSAGRTGRNCWVRHDTNPVIRGLAQRVSALIDMPLTHAESLQVVHYGESQHYAPHFDAWDGNTERGQRCMARGGQRMVTCLFYLNDVAEGGATVFPRLNLEVEAMAGRMLIFYNCHPGTTQRHPGSLHGAMPVHRGEKWACNLWFRENNYW